MQAMGLWCLEEQSHVLLKSGVSAVTGENGFFITANGGIFFHKPYQIRRRYSDNDQYIPQHSRSGKPRPKRAGESAKQPSRDVE